MKFWRILILWLVIALVLLLPGEALAQTYLFSLDQLTCTCLLAGGWQLPPWPTNLSLPTIQSASPIDYVDVGLP